MGTRLPVPEMSDDNREDSSGSGSGSKSEEGDRLTVNSHDETDVQGESCNNLGSSRVSMNGDWFERKTCIKCYEGDNSKEDERNYATDIDDLETKICLGCLKEGIALACSVKQCTLVIDQCSGARPRFVRGEFVCAFCFYNREVTRAVDLRKKVMLAKKALCRDFEVGGVEVEPMFQSVEPSLRNPEFENFFGEDGREEDSLQHTPKKKRKASGDVVQNEKRKKLYWKEEEEDMLREGFQKYSTLGRNIPWRKILKFGAHVFHSTRVPSDLKDKWRNMTK